MRLRPLVRRPGPPQMAAEPRRPPKGTLRAALLLPRVLETLPYRLRVWIPGSRRTGFGQGALFFPCCCQVLLCSQHGKGELTTALLVSISVGKTLLTSCIQYESLEACSSHIAPPVRPHWRARPQAPLSAAAELVVAGCFMHWEATITDLDARFRCRAPRPAALYWARASRGCKLPICPF